MTSLIPQQKLLTLDEVNLLVKDGQKLILAGSELILSKVIQGDWIAGTTPYFICDSGGKKANDLILTTILSSDVTQIVIKQYDSNTISDLTQNYFENGYSIIIIPAYSETHLRFSKESSSWKSLFNQPLIGWISGIDLEDKTHSPQVVNGQTRQSSLNEALIMHVELKKDRIARANIINLFEQGQNEDIQFIKSGFEVSTCLINKTEQSFYDFIIDRKIDIKLPLVANYFGAMINVSIRELDHQAKSVHLFAPVFSGVDYRFAKKLETSYDDEFNKALNKISNPQFACNCILNYIYAHLEFKKTNIACAMTFGEIAYMLMNQTMVYLTIEKK